MNDAVEATGSRFYTAVLARNSGEAKGEVRAGKCGRAQSFGWQEEGGMKRGEEAEMLVNSEKSTTVMNNYEQRCFQNAFKLC